MHRRFLPQSLCAGLAVVSQKLSRRIWAVRRRGCDAQSAAVFIIGLVAGTGCIIVAKMLFEMKAVGSTGELEIFNPPVFESFVMFFGMLFALPGLGSRRCSNA